MFIWWASPANYRYYDMDDTIAAALKLVKHEFQAE